MLLIKGLCSLLLNTEQLLTTAISDVSNFDQGMHVVKYKNIRADGGPVSDAQRNFADIDFPVFPFAEMYLIYAEAVLRGGTGGDATTALTYLNP